MSCDMLTPFVVVVEPNAALKQSQRCHIPHFHQSTKSPAILNPLARLLSQICQNRRLVEIIMDGTRSPSHPAPWRRGVRTRNHSAWRRILQGESRSNGRAVNGPEIRSAPPAEDSGHQIEQTATGESPGCGAAEVRDDANSYLTGVHRLKDQSERETRISA